MNRRPSPPLELLLQARPGPPRERAWAAFLHEYSRLILHVARSFGGSYDEAMDRYAHALELIRNNDFRRLRDYAADGRGKFTTWLVVVVRRACIDQDRHRYGRCRDGRSEEHQQRRRLVDLVAAEVDLELLPGTGTSPEHNARANDLLDHLDDAIERLEPADRLLLRLRFRDEVSVAEIARIGSFSSVFQVYRQLNGIFEQLRHFLEEAGVRDAAP
jgi:RNA polymerase sigma factor (sigma-70 family)